MEKLFNTLRCRAAVMDPNAGAWSTLLQNSLPEGVEFTRPISSRFQAGDGRDQTWSGCYPQHLRFTEMNNKLFVVYSYDAGDDNYFWGIVGRWTILPREDKIKVHIHRKGLMKALQFKANPVGRVWLGRLDLI